MPRRRTSRPAGSPRGRRLPRAGRVVGPVDADVGVLRSSRREFPGAGGRALVLLAGKDHRRVRARRSERVEAVVGAPPGPVEREVGLLVSSSFAVGFWSTNAHICCSSVDPRANRRKTTRIYAEQSLSSRAFNDSCAAASNWCAYGVPTVLRPLNGLMNAIRYGPSASRIRTASIVRSRCCSWSPRRHRHLCTATGVSPASWLRYAQRCAELRPGRPSGLRSLIRLQSFEASASSIRFCASPIDSVAFAAPRVAAPLPSRRRRRRSPRRSRRRAGKPRSLRNERFSGGPGASVRNLASRSGRVAARWGVGRGVMRTCPSGHGRARAGVRVARQDPRRREARGPARPAPPSRPVRGPVPAPHPRGSLHLPALRPRPRPPRRSRS